MLSFIRLLLVTQALLSLFGFATASSICCSKLPAASSKACSSLFEKSYIKKPTHTVYSTATVTKKFSPSTTVTHVTTSTRTVHISKSPTTKIVTSTDTSTNVVTSTYSEPFPITSTETSTSIITSYPWQDECTRDVFGRRSRVVDLGKRASIPKVCSCYLTTTTTVKRTSTKTKTLPEATITKTSTKHTTITLVYDGKTVTDTITQPETVTTTFLIKDQSTTTTTASVTVTTDGISDVCAEPFTFNGRNAFVYEGAELSDTITDSSLSDCCSECFSTPGCANYVFHDETKTCEIYIVKNDNQTDRCRENYCPYGRGYGSFIPDDNKNNLYGPGPCGGGIQR